MQIGEIPLNGQTPQEQGNVMLSQVDILGEAIRLVESDFLHQTEKKKLVSCFLYLDREHRFYFWNMLDSKSRQEITQQMLERMLEWSDDEETTRSVDYGLKIESHADGGTLEQNEMLAAFIEETSGYSGIDKHSTDFRIKTHQDRDQLVSQILSLPEAVREIVIEAYSGTQLISLMAFGADSYDDQQTRSRGRSGR